MEGMVGTSMLSGFLDTATCVYHSWKEAPAGCWRKDSERWFEEFHYGDFNLEGAPSKRQTCSKPGRRFEGLRRGWSIADSPWDCLGNARRVHDWSNRQKLSRFDLCCSLLFWGQKDPFLDRFVTSDGSDFCTITEDEQTGDWCRRTLQAFPKVEIPPQKLWWSAAGIISISMPSPEWLKAFLLGRETRVKRLGSGCSRRLLRLRYNAHSRYLDKFSSQCKRVSRAWMSLGRSFGINKKFRSRSRLYNPIFLIF